jgi:hypothetical protein
MERQDKDQDFVRPKKGTLSEHHATVEPSTAQHVREPNIEQVRELLFGQHVRELQIRAEQLEAQTASALRQSRDQLTQRIDAFEQLVKREFQSIREEIKAERNSREATREELRREISSSEATLHNTIQGLQRECEASYDQLSNDIQNQSIQLRTEGQRAFDHLHDLLSQKYLSLQHTKADRTVMSNLFNEIALRLMDPPDSVDS